jgi:5'-3' exonuclease
MNSLIHHAVNQINKKVNKKQKNLEKHEMIWKRVLKNLEGLISLVKPKHKLFIALDGVSP